ncbi:MAG: Hsp20/alpha crystallin family protein [Chloroflexaceae bacterium]|nr:Hsp20/alpha crystallin family protein [Chloroflexaceae bacterium]
MMPQASKTWCPAIELKEVGHDLILKAELPGVRRQDMHVRAEGDALVIEGERSHNPELQGEELIPSELHYGKFECHVPLPMPIVGDRVRAELIDGVLTVSMPTSV